MNFKTCFALSIGLAGTFVTIAGSAGTLTEYDSLAAWKAAVSNVSSYGFSRVPGEVGHRGPDGPGEVLGGRSVTFGPGALIGNTASAWTYNDKAWGSGVQNLSDDPRAMGQPNADGSVTVDFSAADRITALAFDLGAILRADNIGVSLNGSALEPRAVATAFPSSFIGVTDTTGPTRRVTVTETGRVGGTDAIGGYQTASASPTAAPEISLTSAPAALTMLLGLLAMLYGRRRSIHHSAGADVA